MRVELLMGKVVLINIEANEIIDVNKDEIMIKEKKPCPRPKKLQKEYLYYEYACKYMLGLFIIIFGAFFVMIGCCLFKQASSFQLCLAGFALISLGGKIILSANSAGTKDKILVHAVKRKSY